MKYLGVNELRKLFLNYFESKGHTIQKSFPLVPINDNSLLLINSGMAPLKPYFTGQEIPPGKRMASCQKCIRTSDIDNVGFTSRHGTFFEMLGNFSFGDYFKKEALAWTWEFMTEVVGIDKNRLYPSVYTEDDEAFDIWNKDIGIEKERIFRLGKEDNFWEHGAGPCGPSSEVYYDRGEKYGCGKPGCSVGCDCDRYIEIWNNVFTQFESDGKGNYTELSQKNIDTGMGLERLAVVVQDVESIFDVDTLLRLREKVCEIAGKEYLKDNKWDISIRIITDHVRSATFMISDGIIPSNEGRGYVLRRIIRRAARHGRLLGIEGLFLAGLSDAVIKGSKDGYPELAEKKDFIINVLQQEERKFHQTIDQGLTILNEMQKEMEQNGERVLSGENAFKLYDTYGFPFDLTVEILKETGFQVDGEGFTKCMQVQKDMARKARKATNYMGADTTVYESIDPSVITRFTGYENLEWKSPITVLTTESELVDSLMEGENGTIIVEETPFYAAMGGQSGDTGRITTAFGEFTVEDTVKLSGSKTGHVGKVTKGMIQKGETGVLQVDVSKRRDICKNHSATHLLHKALKSVLGSHVEQAGSYVDGSRLRFDFNHFQAMTLEELKEVEAMVNEQIARGLEVDTKVMDIEEAKKSGATALFGEKYSDKVRVVRMGDFSSELCGGTHVSNTRDITVFKILSESGIAAGVRRIEALTGRGVFSYFDDLEQTLKAAAAAAKTTPAMLTGKIEQLQSELKSLHSENESLKSKAAKDALGDVMDQVKEISGISFLAAKVQDIDMNGLRDLSDQLKNKLGNCVIVLISPKDGRVNIVAMASEEAMSQGAHAGNLIKEIGALVGGGGGGRPNMAQAGGKNPAGIGEALKKAEDVLITQISK